MGWVVAAVESRSGGKANPYRARSRAQRDIRSSIPVEVAEGGILPPRNCGHGWVDAVERSIALRHADFPSPGGSRAVELRGHEVGHAVAVEVGDMGRVGVTPDRWALDCRAVAIAVEGKHCQLRTRGGLRGREANPPLIRVVRMPGDICTTVAVEVSDDEVETRFRRESTLLVWSVDKDFDAAYELRAVPLAEFPLVVAKVERQVDATIAVEIADGRWLCARSERPGPARESRRLRGKEVRTGGPLQDQIVVVDVRHIHQVGLAVPVEVGELPNVVGALRAVRARATRPWGA